MSDTHTPFRAGEFNPEGALEQGLLEGGSRGGRLVPALLIAAISASGLSMLFSVGTAVLTAAPANASETAPAAPARERGHAEETVSLGVELRTFAPFNVAGGHPDFERFSGSTRVGLASDRLGPDGVPTLVSRQGAQIEREYTDAAGRPINPALFDAARDDRAGELSDRADPRVFSEESFAGWFAGAPALGTITLERVAGENRFVFESDRDATALPQGPHTGVIRAELTAQPGQRIGVSSADDAWVYIDGRLAIDLGSTHARRMQWIDLDRLGLTPGSDVAVDVFFAERRSGDRHFRLETNARLRPAGSARARGDTKEPGLAG